MQAPINIFRALVQAITRPPAQLQKCVAKGRGVLPFPHRQDSLSRSVGISAIKFIRLKVRVNIVSEADNLCFQRQILSGNMKETAAIQMLMMIQNNILFLLQKRVFFNTLLTNDAMALNIMEP